MRFDHAEWPPFGTRKARFAGDMNKRPTTAPLNVSYLSGSAKNFGRQLSCIIKPIIRQDQSNVAYSKGLCQLIDGDYGGITVPTFQAAQILLAQPGKNGHLLLCKPFFPAQSGKISTHKFPHIHAEANRSLHIFILSTIICSSCRSSALLEGTRV